MGTLIELSADRELSTRQKDILRLAAQDMTDKEIALMLGLSPGTIRTYWDRLRVRFSLNSRTAIVAFVLQIELEKVAAERDELRAALDALSQPALQKFGGSQVVERTVA